MSSEASMNTDSGTNLEALFAKKAAHEKEIRRIQKKVGEFLTPEDARELARWIYDLALEVDEEIDRILSDPLVEKMYEYDGLFFTPRGTHLFHRAFNGFHVLHSLNNEKLDTFFRGRKKEDAVQWLQHELSTHPWEATIRRMNWEESGTLNTVTKEVMDAIIEDVRERRRLAAENSPSPMSPEDKAFFQPYEQQMATPGSQDPPASLKK